MSISVRFWMKDKDNNPDYSKRVIKRFYGNSARECMDNVCHYRMYVHDLSKYTRVEIVGVCD